MPLENDEALWVYRITGGAVPLPPAAIGPTNDPMAALRQQLEVAQAKDRAEHQALKEAMLSKALGKIDARKEEIRKAFDLKITTVDEKGKAKQEELLPTTVGQEKSFEAQDTSKLKAMPEGITAKQQKVTPNVTGEVTKVGKEFFDEARELNATTAMVLVVEQKEYLAAKKVARHVIDIKLVQVVTKTEPLFTEAELMNELYTPLVREKVIPDTLIDGRFSATQKMIDGSNEYYIKECKEKGKAVGTGGAAFAKGTIELASAITGTVLGALAPVKAGQEAMANSNTLDKQHVAIATAITNGIAALLTTGIDIIDQVDDAVRSGDFSVAGYKQVMNGLATGIGRVVAGATGDSNLGLVITDSIAGFATASSLIPEFYNWQKKGGEPPISAIIDAIGSAIASGFSAASDQTSVDQGSTGFSQAGSIVGAAFATAAKAAEAKLLTAIKKGDWTTVFSVLAAAGSNAAKAVPNCVRFAAEYNAIPTAKEGDKDDKGVPLTKEKVQEINEKAFQDQQKLIKGTQDLATNLDKLTATTEKLSGEAMQEISKKLGLSGKGAFDVQKRLQEMEEKFALKEADQKREVEAEQLREIAQIEKQLEKERKEYQDSLQCLGSTDPSDAEYKSIAKLVAQLERDRAIWNGLFALFGAGLAGASSVAAVSTVATEVVPGLKIAGQLMKFVQNLKAAAERLAAFLTWRESRKDAESAVSPYATSIDNFVSNQGSQFTHYTVQAAANVIQAFLAAGEMSPFGPAFKVAGSGVAAAAAAEDLVYKFMKQQALRKAWVDTKEVLDPKNKGNRKMALLVRQINPTLAKYTIAYGALIERSPIAITAMNRIGLDRETLTRAGDKVKDVKDYMEKLYLDDGVVVGQLDAEGGKTKVPAASLTAKTWSLSRMIWQEENGLATTDPPKLVASLTRAERLTAKVAPKVGEAVPAMEERVRDLELLFDTLCGLENAFKGFKPATENGVPINAAAKKVGEYADLAYARSKATDMDLADLRSRLEPVAT